MCKREPKNAESTYCKDRRLSNTERKVLTRLPELVSQASSLGKCMGLACETSQEPPVRYRRRGRCYSDMCSPREMGNVCPRTHFTSDIRSEQISLGSGVSPCTNISDMCFHLQSLHLDDIGSD